MATEVSPQVDTPLTRADFVAERIERAILRGELAAGERIIEGVWAERLKVSKTPIREALRVLGIKGVVTTHAYRGTVVRDIDPVEARHLFEVRLLIEPDAVVRAIPNHDDSSLAACRDALVAAHNAGADRIELADRAIANRRFHQLLYARCENAHLRKILDDVQDQVAMISVATWHRRSTWVEEEDEHAAILDAVGAGQSDLVYSLMREHISRFFSKIAP